MPSTLAPTDATTCEECAESVAMLALFSQSYDPSIASSVATTTSQAKQSLGVVPLFYMIMSMPRIRTIIPGRVCPTIDLLG